MHMMGQRREVSPSLKELERRRRQLTRLEAGGRSPGSSPMTDLVWMVAEMGVASLMPGVRQVIPGPPPSERPPQRIFKDGTEGGPELTARNSHCP